MVGSRILVIGGVLGLVAGVHLPPPGSAQADSANPASPPAVIYLLDPQGRVVGWRPGRPGFAAVDTIGEHVNALTAVGSGRLLVLPVMGDEEAAHRRPRGTAILYDMAQGAGPRALFETRFEGQGYAVAVREDAGIAYVLAHLRRSHDIDPGKAWLHAIDLDSGRLIASAALPEPPNGIAVSPRDGRIFLALVNRILTYSSSPLASSWQYRSPGVNLALRFRPASDLLFVIRIHELALFDPTLIAGRDSAERLALRDDATLTIGLPLQAAEIAFPDENLPVLAAFGRSAPVVFVDWRAGTLLGAPGAPGALRGAELIQYLPLAAATPNAIAFAALPAGEVVELPVPPPRAAPPPAMMPAPLPADPVAAPAPVAAPPSAAPLAPPATPAPTAEPTPTGAAVVPGATTTPSTVLPGVAGDDDQAPPSEPPPDRVALTRPGGRLTGRRDLVAAIVMFGPDSIVREQARTAPDAEGVWELAAPAAGVYRIVPIGVGGRPLLARPNFHTLSVPAGIGPSYDFDILGTP